MMKKVRLKRIVIAIAVVVILIAVYLIYSRPMTLSKLYPMLTLDKCTVIHGDYKVGSQAEPVEFTFDKDSEEFQKLCTLLYEQKYSRSLRDALPQGTRTHQAEPDDFQWNIIFSFEDIDFPDGSVNSGTLLSVQSWYGELDIYFDGERYSCSTNNQDAWAKKVLEIIQ